MKFVRLSFLPALIIVLISFASCDKGNPPEPSIEEAQLKLMTKTWTVSEVRFGSGNTDRTQEYTGMTLTISGTFAEGGTYNYAASGRPSLSPWPANGTWTFDTNDPENLIIRTEDNLPISYSVVDNKLQLVFTYAGSGYSRISAVEGTWTFLFTGN